MKTVIKFGVRGGALCDDIVAESAKAGAKLACRLIHVLSNGESKGRQADYTVGSDKPRVSWQSSSHFVDTSMKMGDVSKLKLMEG